MKKQFSILAAALMFCLGAGAQSFGEIQGTLVDENGKALEFADVFVQAGDKIVGTQTDKDGDFKIKPLLAGTYELHCSFITYKPYIIQDMKVRPDKITFAGTVKMVPDLEMLGDAEIVTYVFPIIDVDNTGMVGLTAEEIEHMPEQKNIVKFVGLTTPGVTMSPDGSELYFRGSRGGTNLYYIDGVKIIGQIPNIPSSGIGTLAVYTGGVPAKYGDFTGGVIVIETKNFFDTYRRSQAEQN
jgi:hypothetical protein